MEDRDFFDLIYQQWSKTTGASDTFWGTEQDQTTPWKRDFSIFAMDQEQNKTPIAIDLKEDDADFIAAIHGCLPDLVRRLHMAVDESDRLDYERDARECRIAELEIENQELRDELQRMREGR